MKTLHETPQRRTRLAAPALAALVALGAFGALAPQAAAVPSAYLETFEDGAGEWSLGGLWHTDTCLFTSPITSLAFNHGGCPSNFEGYNYGMAVSPPIPTGGAITGTVSWNSFYDTEVGGTYDRKEVYVYDGWNFYQIWKEEGSPLTWTPRTVPITVYGPDIWLYFIFDTVDSTSNSGLGWFIDDVSVVFEGPIPTAPNPRTHDDGNGNCMLYDDSNFNGSPDGGESIAYVPCVPDIQTYSHPDGSFTVYDDRNHNRNFDSGEELATVPRVPNPALADNRDATCTVFDDADGDGVRDSGEDSFGTVPCPDIQLKGNADGSTTVYNDGDHDRNVDSGEEVFTTVPLSQSNTFTRRDILNAPGILITPAQPLPAEDFDGVVTPDYPGTAPVVTPDYPGTDPVPTPDVPPTTGTVTPPVGERLGDVNVRDAGPDICVDVIPEGGSAINIVCVNRATLGPAGTLVPRGSVELLFVNPPDVPPTPGVGVPDVPGTAPVAVPDVPGTPGVTVPDVPAVPKGSLGSTPETRMSLSVHYYYDPAHVTRLISLVGGLGEIWLPSEPTDVGTMWYTMNAEDLGLVIEATVYRDGVEQGTVNHSIPFLGQALAAADYTVSTIG